MRDLTIHDFEAELLPARELMCVSTGPVGPPPPPPGVDQSNTGNGNTNQAGNDNESAGNGNFSGNEINIGDCLL